jgi:hypothetical protein
MYIKKLTNSNSKKNRVRARGERREERGERRKVEER